MANNSQLGLRQNLWGWGLAIAISAFFIIVGFLCSENLEKRCQNELYLLSAIAQSIAAITALVIASASIIMGSRYSVRRMAGILIREKTIRWAYLLSFFTLALALLLLRTGYHWRFLWAFFGFSIGCIVLVAIAVYNLITLLDLNYFTDFVTAKSICETNALGNGEDEVAGSSSLYTESLNQWIEVLLDHREEDLARKALAALQRIAYVNDSARVRLIRLLQMARDKSEGNQSWYVVAEYI